LPPGTGELPDVVAVLVRRPGAVAEADVADLLDGLAVAHVDLGELGVPALHAEAAHHDREVELLEYQLCDRVAGVHQERLALRLTGAGAEIAGLDDAGLRRRNTVAGEDSSRFWSSKS
jgi:hypothetical protein